MSKTTARLRNKTFINFPAHNVQLHILKEQLIFSSTAWLEPVITGVKSAQNRALYNWLDVVQ